MNGDKTRKVVTNLCVAFRSLCRIAAAHVAVLSQHFTANSNHNRIAKIGRLNLLLQTKKIMTRHVFTCLFSCAPSLDYALKCIRLC